MDITLKRAALADAERLWAMEREAFLPLYEKYHDDETNPANEPLEAMRGRLRHPSTYYYFILCDGEIAGAIRVADAGNGTAKRISPLFVLPRWQNRGIAQQAIRAAEALHGAHGWALATILQEKGNCHLYEKLGYRPTGETRAVNDALTLIFYEKP